MIKESDNLTVGPSASPLAFHNQLQQKTSKWDSFLTSEVFVRININKFIFIRFHDKIQNLKVELTALHFNHCEAFRYCQVCREKNNKIFDEVKRLNQPINLMLTDFLKNVF